MFKLVLTNGTDDLELFFKVRDTTIAHKWFNELKKNYEIYERDRFSNWGTHTFIEQLNESIDTINEYEPLIDMKVTDKTTQQDLNYLHKFFEDLRGEITESTEWFVNAPEHVKDAVQKFNVVIHLLEDELRSKGKNPSVVVTFKDRPRFLLSDEDIKHFTYKWEYGCVYINYCQVGKTVLDAFKDNDSITEAIRPQTHYSADFFVKFGPSTNSVFHFFRNMWFKFWLFRKKLPFDNLNVGMIPVADSIFIIPKEELIKYNRVKGVYV